MAWPEQEPPRGAIEMTIWVLLLGCCFLAPIFLALRLAGDAHAAITSYVLSLIVGLLIGTGFAMVMAKVHSRMVRTGSTIVLLGAFAAELVWVGITGIVGWWAVTILLHSLR